MMKQLSIILLVLILVFSVVTIVMRWSIDFNKTAWMNADGTTKYRMAINLKESKILMGKSTLEVEKLLGTADDKSPKYLYYAVDQPLGYKDSLNIVSKNDVVIDVYISD